ncbi:hypothetical protein QQP08_003858 [Theobroma cacao]|nr:hypothetical protein QQP08_003858 [Theobroma cacao]
MNRSDQPKKLSPEHGHELHEYEYARAFHVPLFSLHRRQSVVNTSTINVAIAEAIATNPANVKLPQGFSLRQGDPRISIWERTTVKGLLFLSLGSTRPQGLAGWLERLGILQGNARGMTALQSDSSSSSGNSGSSTAWKNKHVWRERNDEIGVREVVLDLACEQLGSVSFALCPHKINLFSFRREFRIELDVLTRAVGMSLILSAGSTIASLG